MTLTRIRPPAEVGFGDPAELLIREARRRARRRRLVIGFVVLVVIVATALVIANDGNGGPSHVAVVHVSRGSLSSAVSGNNATAAIPGGQGVQSLWPVGGQTSWVYTVNETALSHGAQGIQWTNNGGRTWRDATPKGYTYGGGNRYIESFFALTSTRAWLVVGPVSPARLTMATLLVTSNAGHSWFPVGPLPLSGCSIDFSTA